MRHKRLKNAFGLFKRAAALIASVLMLVPSAPPATPCAHLVGKNGACCGCFTPFEQLAL